MARITAPVPPGGPPPMHSQILRSWAGGLNLGADDFQLALDETPDALDVDPSPLGGFLRRPSFRSLGASGLDTDKTPKFLFHYQSDANDNGFILMGGQVGAEDKLAVWATGDQTDGEAPTALRSFGTESTLNETWSGTLVGPPNAVGNDVVCIIHRDRIAPADAFRKDGTMHGDFTDAHGNYNEDLTNPVGGRVPRASIGCGHLVYLFHADTMEDTDRHPNRIRWSHPGWPTDYREDDFLDIGEGQDNDVIKALVSWGPTLFIFKERSVWALSGYNGDTFAVTRIADNIGAANKNCAVSTQNGVFFFDEFLGVHQIQPSGKGWKVTPLWTHLNPAIDDGRITNMLNACMGVAGQKVYISGLKWRSSTHSTRTFVYDFAAEDGWWAYSVGFHLLRGYTFNTGEEHIMGAFPWTNRNGETTTYRNFLAIQQQLSTDLDDRFDASTEKTYTGHLVTGWVDGGDAGMKKRFRRFSMVFDNIQAASPFTVLTYRNWSTVTPAARTFSVTGTADASVADFGTQISRRGGAIGSGYSAAVKITGPSDRAWGVNSVTFRFIPQRVI